MSLILGIDLGTTNSLVGVVDSGFPLLLADTQGSRITPSAVAFAISIAPGMEAAFAPARIAAQAAAQQAAEGRKVMVSLTSDKTAAATGQAAAQGQAAVSPLCPSTTWRCCASSAA